MKTSHPFLLIIMVLSLFSCKTENDTTDKTEIAVNDYSLEETEKIESDKTETDANNSSIEEIEKIKSDKTEREEDIELLKEFWTKEKQSIKDENGFKIDYRVEEKNPTPVLLAISDTVSTSETGRRERLQFVKLGLLKETYSLFLDGDHIKDVDVVYQVYQVVTAQAGKYSKQVLKEIGDGEAAWRDVEYWEIKEEDFYEHDRLYYSPELHPKERRNEIIGEITFNWVLDEGGPNKKEAELLGEEINEVVKKAIEKSEIFKYKTLKDIEDFNFS